MKKRRFSYTVPDIAEEAGVSHGTAKRHRRNGSLDPDNLGSVASYIAGHKQIMAARRKEEERPEVDAPSE